MHTRVGKCSHNWDWPGQSCAWKCVHMLGTVAITETVARPELCKHKEVFPLSACTHAGACVLGRVHTGPEYSALTISQDLSTQWWVTVGLEHLHLAPLGDLPHPHLSSLCASQQHMGCMVPVNPLQRKLRSLTRSVSQHMGCNESTATQTEVINTQWITKHGLHDASESTAMQTEVFNTQCITTHGLHGASKSTATQTEVFNTQCITTHGLHANEFTTTQTKVISAQCITTDGLHDANESTVTCFPSVCQSVTHGLHSANESTASQTEGIQF